jgi:hypothetical protein
MDVSGMVQPYLGGQIPRRVSEGDGHMCLTLMCKRAVAAICSDGGLRC